ncbi:MAG: hypothetical protein GWN01_09280 [Nitrosopumilaceae archaeon]|nr:hypothetical protein [Nitrosopumilaceae archaeon]NIU87801.1 hypothetical protein [Nitrosopumilaceae archaeon]NIV65184.1 hypothetical protein [Nitrosopumilaceae archaeon]NIX61699.1 hypothetical protein [Nitrosopumilaceae archaeon]
MNTINEFYRVKRITNALGWSIHPNIPDIAYPPNQRPLGFNDYPDNWIIAGKCIEIAAKQNWMIDFKFGYCRFVQLESGSVYHKTPWFSVENWGYSGAILRAFLDVLDDKPFSRKISN